MSVCRVIRACLTPRGISHLTAGGDLRVHSVFHRVVNLLAGGRMLSLADESLGDMPDTLYLPAGAPEILRSVRGEEKIVFRDGTLTAGCISICLPEEMFEPMGVYAPGPRTKDWAGRLLEVCEGEKKESALERLPAPWRGRVLSALEDFAAALLRGEDVSGSVGNGIRYAGRILGLGPGATPSADDAVLAVLATMYPATVHFSDDMLAETSAVSAKYLRCGEEGYYARVLTELLDDPVPARAHAVAACGATSGADMLYGLRAACRVLMRAG